MKRVGQAPLDNYRAGPAIRLGVIPPNVIPLDLIPLNVIPGRVPGTWRATVLVQVPGTSPGMTLRGMTLRGMKLRGMTLRGTHVIRLAYC